MGSGAIDSRLLVYGANGYTGRLVARTARERGFTPCLAGRDAAAVERVAEELDLPWRAFGLDDPAALDAGLEGVAAVLHCAGPFSRTWRAMSDACLRTGVHYLDVTGELVVFEGLAGRGEAARKAGVTLLPGVGFDVVPSDCLAAHLARRLPDATALALAFQASGGVSHGTATTLVENMGASGFVRRGGRIVPIPAGSLTRRVDFGDGPRPAVAIPWGDVSTAFHTTGIGDIEVFVAAGRAAIWGMRLGRYCGAALRSPVVRRFLQRRIDARPAGPDDAARERGRTLLWGEARAADGRSVACRMRAPEGYTLTADASLAIAAKLLDGEGRPGFHTPAGLFGPDLVLELEGVRRTDL
ncbi:MAG: saccharopine dehydrogenase NADP-binding domain-containing protein [Planctomycetota bacterium]|jgi:short subunit dehydrogenase-like uncharacterized protein|nr:saccharopine dehydrogenase NADP-binding domain-containing protein [Planctomycetota bacterium]MDP6761463.1 saccharopine dehydrogenase NADP-binding domain-containing protein [Planctomycetota bacterium]MDP6988093.1 saccharopine dehydrogenase NADP-binding domain-containing protein [Planctomycetota bacterium]